MIDVFIQEGILDEGTTTSGKSGVYIIMFDDGYYYIGSSHQLNWRIRNHLRAMKTDFSCVGTCKALKLMKGFSGKASIYLLNDAKNISKREELYEIERSYINTFAGDHLMLNFVPIPIILHSVN